MAKEVCRNCRSKDDNLNKKGYCPRCGDWIPLSVAEKARRIRDVVRHYPDGHPERTKYEALADEMEKGLDNVPTR